MPHRGGQRDESKAEPAPAEARPRLSLAVTSCPGSGLGSSKLGVGLEQAALVAGGARLLSALPAGSVGIPSLRKAFSYFT